MSDPIGDNKMQENRYALAGWIAIANAGLIPLAIVVGILYSVVTAKLMGFYGASFGPGDLIGIVTTLFSVYILLKFRDLIRERYNFHEIDGLILASIIWLVLSQIGALGLKGLQFLVGSGRDEEIFMAIIAVSFLAVSMVVVGIIDIMIAVKLMKIKDQVSDPLKFFIYLTLVAGILEVSIIFSLFSLLLLPIVFITYGVIFFRDHQQVEFV